MIGSAARVQEGAYFATPAIGEHNIELALFPLNLCKETIHVDHDSTAPGSAKEQSQYRWHWDHPAI
jgi:hypothetical protein